MDIQQEFDITKWYKDDPRYYVDKRAKIIIYDMATHELIESFVDTKEGWAIFSWQNEDAKWQFNADDNWNDGFVWCFVPERNKQIIEIKKPKVITLCGSTKFMDEFNYENARLTMEGNIVISVGIFGRGHFDQKRVLTYTEKEDLDKLHKRKIDLSDEIFVINVGGYIGKSTLSEIAYARRTNKKINWLEQKKALPENMDLENLDLIEVRGLSFEEQVNISKEEEINIIRDDMF